jgi:hypothetical protein
VQVAKAEWFYRGMGSSKYPFQEIQKFSGAFVRTCPSTLGDSMIDELVDVFIVKALIPPYGVGG